MACIAWVIAVIAIFCVLLYQRASLKIWTISLGLLLLFATRFNGLTAANGIGWLLYLLCWLPLNISFFRQRYIASPILSLYRKIMPAMSRTEREAISAGTVTWEGDLFRGNPNWYKLLKMPKASLTDEEQAFLN